MSPLVAILALAMPAITLHILFAPAVNAVGHPRISLQASLFGALLMPLAFLAGVRWGAMGLAFAWVGVFPAVPLFAFVRAKGVLGIDARRLALALAPGLGASAAMALPVVALGHALADWQPWARLAAQVATGGLTYAAVLFVASRATLDELVLLVVRRRPEVQLAE